MKDLVALIITEALIPVLVTAVHCGAGVTATLLNLLDSSGKAKKPLVRAKQDNSKEEVQVALTPVGESLAMRMCPVTLWYPEGHEDRHFKENRSLLERSLPASSQCEIHKHLPYG